MRAVIVSELALVGAPMIGTADKRAQIRARQKSATSSLVLAFQAGKSIQIGGPSDNPVLFRTAVILDISISIIISRDACFFNIIVNNWAPPLS